MQRARITVLFIILILFVGLGIWGIVETKSKQTNTLTLGEKTFFATQMTTNVRLLLSEHGTLAAEHLSDMYDGKDTVKSAKQLEDNTQKLADVIEKLGNKEDRAAFVTTFRGHIKEYENYTRELKEENKDQMTQTKELLAQHAVAFGKLTHKLLPTISEGQAEKLMNDHVAITLAIVDAHAQKNTAEKLKLLGDATVQANQFANELGKGIAEKYHQEIK